MKRRLRELESIIGKLYEDNAVRRLSDTRMNKLLPKYEQEAETLEGRVATIEATSNAPEQSEQAPCASAAHTLHDLPPGSPQGERQSVKNRT